MSIAVVIQTQWEAPAMAAWAWQVARARKTDVIVLFVGGRDTDDDSPGAQAIRAAISDVVDLHAKMAAAQADAAGSDRDDAERCPEFKLAFIKAAKSAASAPAVLDALHEHGAKFLIIAKHEKAQNDDALSAVLFREARCGVLLLRPGEDSGKRCRRILIPTSGGPHATEALKLADAMAHQIHATCGIDQHASPGVDALFVEPDVGPEAELVGRHILDKAMRKALGDLRDHPLSRPIVELATDYRKGIATVAQRGGYDLILVGATNQWNARRALFGVVPEKLLREEAGGLSVGVVRAPIPLLESATQALRGVLKRGVPQLERDDRITLVERIQGSSKWDFDFISLICLSTIIATLGLMQNSVAVVIGAMLVAPLMTPLVGCGLAIVQGNGLLIRNAIKAVLLGFVLAFSIGYIMGLVVPDGGLTDQMLSRGKPNVLDLGVAFFSGMAAAYATARPGLSAALPGVAIAAALVPPIATSGVAMSEGDVITSAGAALLFITNIVAIVLGAAVSLYAVGMQAAHLHAREKRWTRRAAMGLIVTTIVLCMPLGYILYRQLPGASISAALHDAIEQRIEAQPGAELVRIDPPRREDDGWSLVVVRQAPDAPPMGLADALAKEVAAQTDQPYRVYIKTQLMAEGSSGR